MWFNFDDLQSVNEGPIGSPNDLLMLYVCLACFGPVQFHFENYDCGSKDK